MIFIKQKQEGFALLITIIVLSVVLAIGLSLLEISLKQINLTITARDSELAFGAANAGVECAQYSRFQIPFNSDFASGSFRFNCFGSSRSLTIGGAVPPNSMARQLGLNSRVKEYQTMYNLSEDGSQSCVDFTLFVIDNRPYNVPYTFTFTNQGVASRVCPANSVCTNIFSRGYNRSCGAIGDLNTVQREMTAEF